MIAWTEPTRWRDRLRFNTWRAPFPYLFHRWDVMVWNGWAEGFWRRSSAEKMAQKLREET